MNKPLIEIITPFSCPVTKETAFIKAAESFGSSIVLTNYNYNYKTSDILNWNSKCTTPGKFYQVASQQPRYNGLFGASGSIWADSVNGLYNMDAATKAKIADLLDDPRAWSIEGNHTYDGTNVTVNVKVKSQTGVANTNIRCLVWLQEKATSSYKHQFRQCVNGWQGTIIPDTLHENEEFSFSVTSAVNKLIKPGSAWGTDFDVVVAVVDTTPYNGYGLDPLCQRLCLGAIYA